jgi:hypothetical protein
VVSRVNPQMQRRSSAVDSVTDTRHAQNMTDVPGGTVGWDVCGTIVAADKVTLHSEWHRTEEERLEGLERTLRELAERVEDRRA